MLALRICHVRCRAEQRVARAASGRNKPITDCIAKRVALHSAIVDDQLAMGAGHAMASPQHAQQRRRRLGVHIFSAQLADRYDLVVETNTSLCEMSLRLREMPALLANGKHGRLPTGRRCRGTSLTRAANLTCVGSLSLYMLSMVAVLYVIALGSPPRLAHSDAVKELMARKAGMQGSKCH